MAAARKTASVPNPRVKVAKTVVQLQWSILFCRNLRAARLAKGLTQARLADHVRGLGVKLDPTVVGRMEKPMPMYGDGSLISVSLDMAAAICEVLDVELASMLANPNDKK